MHLIFLLLLAPESSMISLSFFFRRVCQQLSCRFHENSKLSILMCCHKLGKMSCLMLHINACYAVDDTDISLFIINVVLKSGGVATSVIRGTDQDYGAQVVGYWAPECLSSGHYKSGKSAWISLYMLKVRWCYTPVNGVSFFTFGLGSLLLFSSTCLKRGTIFQCWIIPVYSCLTLLCLF